MQIYKAGVAEYSINKMTTVGHAQLCPSLHLFCRVFLAMLGCCTAVRGSAVTTQSITTLSNLSLANSYGIKLDMYALKGRLPVKKIVSFIKRDVLILVIIRL